MLAFTLTRRQVREGGFEGDFHIQHPPKKLSISINLIPVVCDVDIVHGDMGRRAAGVGGTVLTASVHRGVLARALTGG